MPFLFICRGCPLDLRSVSFFAKLNSVFMGL
jgi:hypothetical protein